MKLKSSGFFENRYFILDLQKDCQHKNKTFYSLDRIFHDFEIGLKEQNLVDFDYSRQQMKKKLFSTIIFSKCQV